MSISFYIGELNKDGRVYLAESCDCSRRWCDDCDAAWERGETAPEEYHCEICDAQINMANSNAMDLFTWLGLPMEYIGSIPARELAPKLRRRLWDVERNHDEAIPGEESGGPGTGQCRMIYAGRRPGYLRSQCERLLATCERAGDRFIIWG